MGAFMKVSTIMPLPQKAGVAPMAPPQVSSSVSQDWQADLMKSLIGFPTMLTRCNLGFDKLKMFQEAMKSPKGLHFKFQFPSDDVGARDVTRKMASAIKDWGNHDYKDFGHHLGGFAREVVFLAGKEGTAQGGPSRLFSVDDQLRINIEGYLKQEEEEAENVTPKALPVSAMYGGIAMILLLVIMVVRAVRPFRATRASSSSDKDGFTAVEAELLEAGDLEEMEIPVE